MKDESPLVSVFTACKNSKKYARSTLDSIVSQSYKNIEIVIADGQSTDGTVEILREYAAKDTRLKWKSEVDNDATEGFYKALTRTSGKYVMLLPFSDLYLNKDWITKCVDILESRKEVSLVHGCPVYIDEEGAMTGVPFVQWLNKPLPSLEDFTAYYLASNCYVSELTYCVRRSVYVKCFTDKPEFYPKDDSSAISKAIRDPFLWFLLEFFKSGYLAYYVPLFVAGGRIHSDSRNKKLTKYIQTVAKRYKGEIAQVRTSFFFGRRRFDFLNSDSEVFKTIQGRELFLFKLKIIYYRLTVKPMFEYGRNIPLFILSKLFQLLIEDPKNFFKSFLKRAKNTLTGGAD